MTESLVGILCKWFWSVVSWQIPNP